MTRDDYWAIIEAARGESEDASEVAQAVEAELLSRKPAEVYAFLEQQAKLLEESYDNRLWGAAYLVNGGCSDDGFDYFRGWLLARGRAVFERVLANPDTLADFAPDDGDEAESEDMLVAGTSAYKKLTGAYPEGPQVHLPALTDTWDFDDEDEMAKRYPRLSAKRQSDDEDDEDDEE